MLASQTLSDRATQGRAPMPVDAPPVGPARARRLRLLQLRESTLGCESHVDADAIASVIARRALFTQRLAARLTDEMRADSVLAGRQAV